MQRGQAEPREGRRTLSSRETDVYPGLGKAGEVRAGSEGAERVSTVGAE